MLSTTSCLLKNNTIARAAVPLNSKLSSAFSASALVNGSKLSIRPLSLTPLRLEENKVEPPKVENTTEVPPKEAPEQPKEAPEQPKEAPKCDSKCNCKKNNCCCKKAILMLALAGIAGTAYYYYENRGIFIYILILIH